MANIFEREGDLSDSDAVWQYAYDYFLGCKIFKCLVPLAICIVSMMIGVGTTIYTSNFQGDTQQYLALTGPGVAAYLVSTVALLAFMLIHHRFDCHARDFACKVVDSNVCDKADVRALYRAWQP